MGKKATKAEVEARVTKVYQMILAAEPPSRIIQYAAEKWQLSERMAYAYMKKAFAEITAQAETHRDYEFGKALARLNQLYNQASKVQDYGLALRIAQEVNRLLALYEPTRIAVQHSGEVAHTVAVLRGVSMDDL